MSTTTASCSPASALERLTVPVWTGRAGALATALRAETSMAPKGIDKAKGKNPLGGTNEKFRPVSNDDLEPWRMAWNHFLARYAPGFRAILKARTVGVLRRSQLQHRNYYDIKFVAPKELRVHLSKPLRSLRMFADFLHQHVMPEVPSDDILKRLSEANKDVHGIGKLNLDKKEALGEGAVITPPSGVSAGLVPVIKQKRARDFQPSRLALEGPSMQSSGDEQVVENPVSPSGRGSGRVSERISERKKTGWLPLSLQMKPRRNMKANKTAMEGFDKASGVGAAAAPQLLALPAPPTNSKGHSDPHTDAPDSPAEEVLDWTDTSNMGWTGRKGKGKVWKMKSVNRGATGGESTPGGRGGGRVVAVGTVHSKKVPGTSKLLRAEAHLAVRAVQDEDGLPVKKRRTPSTKAGCGSAEHALLLDGVGMIARRDSEGSKKARKEREGMIPEVASGAGPTREEDGRRGGQRRGTHVADEREWEGERRQLLSRIDELNLEVSKEHERIRVLGKDVEEERGAREGLKLQVEQLAQWVANERNEKKQLESDKAELEAEKSGLEKQKAALAQKLEEAQKQADAAWSESDVHKLQMQVASLEGQVRMAEQKLEEEGRGWGAERAEVQASARQAQEAVANAAEEEQRWRQAFEQLMQRNTRTELQLSNAKQVLERCSVEEQQTNDALERLQRKLEEAEEGRRKVELNVGQLQVELQAERQEGAEAKAVAAGLAKESQQRMTQLQAIEELRARATAYAAQLVQQSDQQQRRVELMEQQVGLAGVRLKEAANEAQRMHQLLEEFRVKEEAATVGRREAEAAFGQLHAEWKQVRAALAGSEARVAALAAERQALVLRQQETEQKLGEADMKEVRATSYAAQLTEQYGKLMNQAERQATALTATASLAEESEAMKQQLTAVSLSNELLLLQNEQLMAALMELEAVVAAPELNAVKEQPAGGGCGCGRGGSAEKARSGQPQVVGQAVEEYPDKDPESCSTDVVGTTVGGGDGREQEMVVMSGEQEGKVSIGSPSGGATDGDASIAEGWARASAALPVGGGSPVRLGVVRSEEQTVPAAGCVQQADKAAGAPGREPRAPVGQEASQGSAETRAQHLEGAWSQVEGGGRPPAVAEVAPLQGERTVIGQSSATDRMPMQAGGVGRPLSDTEAAKAAGMGEIPRQQGWEGSADEGQRPAARQQQQTQQQQQVMVHGQRTLPTGVPTLTRAEGATVQETVAAVQQGQICQHYGPSVSLAAATLRPNIGHVPQQGPAPAWLKVSEGGSREVGGGSSSQEPDGGGLRMLSGPEARNGELMSGLKSAVSVEKGPRREEGGRTSSEQERNLRASTRDALSTADGGGLAKKPIEGLAGGALLVLSDGAHTAEQALEQSAGPAGARGIRTMGTGVLTGPLETTIDTVDSGLKRKRPMDESEVQAGKKVAVAGPPVRSVTVANRQQGGQVGASSASTAAVQGESSGEAAAAKGTRSGETAGQPNSARDVSGSRVDACNVGPAVTVVAEARPGQSTRPTHLMSASAAMPALVEAPAAMTQTPPVSAAGAMSRTEAPRSTAGFIAVGDPEGVSQCSWQPGPVRAGGDLCEHCGETASGGADLSRQPTMQQVVAGVEGSGEGVRKQQETGGQRGQQQEQMPGESGVGQPMAPEALKLREQAPGAQAPPQQQERASRACGGGYPPLEPPDTQRELQAHAGQQHKVEGQVLLSVQAAEREQEGMIGTGRLMMPQPLAVLKGSQAHQAHTGPVQGTPGSAAEQTVMQAVIAQMAGPQQPGGVCPMGTSSVIG